MRRRDVLLSMAAVVAAAGRGAAQTEARVAVLSVAGAAWLREALALAVAATGAMVLDAGLVNAAARGAGYDGSLNLTVGDARALARVIGATHLALVTGSIVERESDNERHWDGFAGLFFVDGRSGQLIQYKGVRSTAGGFEGARATLLARIDADVATWARTLASRPADEAITVRTDVPLDLVATSPIPPDAIEPRFFKRPSPAFTEDADRARAVATVDLVVHFNADGTYGPIEVVRWAGFGLDEAAIEAVRAAAFYPARIDGRPVAARALLRFNFRFRDR